jgi:hypothetical protein
MSLEFWKKKLKEVEEKGNFTTGRNNGNYFSEKYTQEEKIEYINKKIKYWEDKK